MKYTKFCLTAALLLSLSGCLYQSVNSYDLDRATKVCEGYEVVEITANFVGVETTTCSDGKKYKLLGG